ncbi:MAG: DNA polymerase III subunit chi [Magnetococcales bacterium]|nr:DNA polymerase III subunit chi [Magnetococcales bacterium]
MARVREGNPVARFYQVAASSPESVMITLLHKLFDQGLRVCLLAGDGAQARRLDDLLWRHPPERFLPHGMWDGADVERQPVLIALTPDDRNGATVVLSTSPRVVPDAERFDVVVDFVVAADPAPARERYRHYQAAGLAMEYWIQSPEGRWTRHGA